MPSLQIYDTKGNEYSPSGGTGRTNERVKELFYAGVRFAVESVGKTRVTAFFRARKTRDARSEQFYAEYTTRDASSLVADFNSALKNRVESEWGYTIDDSSDEMGVFRAIKQNAASVPGSDQDRRVLREMIGSGAIVNVGVRDATNAVGLIQEMAKDCSRAAITDSANTDSLSEFDLAIVTGRHSGIEPLGATEKRWEQTEESLRQQFIDEEVGRIEDAVHTLSRDHGLSSSEIRSRVTRRVPALKAPSSGSSGLASSVGSNDDDGLITARMGKLAALGAVALLVLIGGVFGAGMVFGIGPFAGGGGGDTIQGTVYADADRNATVEGATVLLYDDTADGEPTTETNTSADGTYSFSDLNESEYTVSVHSEVYEYENETGVTPGNGSVDFEPIGESSSTSSEQEDDDGATLRGAVSDSGSAEPVEADLILTTDTGEEVVTRSDAEDGSYELSDIPPGDHSVDVTADGYQPETRTVTVDGDTSEDFELTESASYNGTVIDADTDDGVNDADVTLLTGDGEEVETVASEPLDDPIGEFDFGELPAGSYEVIVEKGGYETYTGEFRLEPGEHREDTIELQPN